MSNEIITLSDKQIKDLKQLQSPIVFQNDFNLIYESQVPNVGVIILEGELKLSRKKKVLPSPPLGSLIGLYHIFHNIPLPISVKICKNSQIIALEKSVILEAITAKSGLLYQLFSSL